jgi:hypothetical protein
MEKNLLSKIIKLLITIMELFLLLGFKIYKAIVLPKIKKMGFCYYLITMLILLIIKFNLIRKQGFSYEEVV